MRTSYASLQFPTPLYFPCAMALRLISRSPRGIGLSCPRRLLIAGSSAPGWADLPSTDLMPTTEASGPHDFAVRSGTARQHVPGPLTEFIPPRRPFPRTMPPRPPQLLPQRSVTMANAPSSGTGWGGSYGCFALREKRNFTRRVNLSQGWYRLFASRTDR